MKVFKSISMSHFIKHKPLISEEWSRSVFNKRDVYGPETSSSHDYSDEFGWKQNPSREISCIFYECLRS